jgi:hypothetical protein
VYTGRLLGAGQQRASCTARDSLVRFAAAEDGRQPAERAATGVHRAVRPSTHSGTSGEERKQVLAAVLFELLNALKVSCDCCGPGYAVAPCGLYSQPRCTPAAPAAQAPAAAICPYPHVRTLLLRLDAAAAAPTCCRRITQRSWCPAAAAARPSWCRRTWPAV